MGTVAVCVNTGNFILPLVTGQGEVEAGKRQPAALKILSESLPEVAVADPCVDHRKANRLRSVATPAMVRED